MGKGRKVRTGRMEFSCYRFRTYCCHWWKKQRGRWCSHLGRRGPQGQRDMKNKKARKSQIPPAPRGFGFVPTIPAWGSGEHRNLRNGEEGERWKECQPLKRVNNLKPIPLGRTNSSISTLIRTQTRNSPSWCMVWMDRSSGQGLKYRRFIKEKNKGRE